MYTLITSGDVEINFETTFLQKQKQGRLTDLTKAHFPFCFLKTSLAMVRTFSLPQSCLLAARLAQSVEYQTFNLRIMGSSPISGDNAFYNFSRLCFDFFLAHK